MKKIRLGTFLFISLLGIIFTSCEKTDLTPQKEVVKNETEPVKRMTSLSPEELKAYNLPSHEEILQMYKDQQNEGSSRSSCCDIYSLTNLSYRWVTYLNMVYETEGNREIVAYHFNADTWWGVGAEYLDLNEAYCKFGSIDLGFFLPGGIRIYTVVHIVEPSTGNACATRNLVWQN